MLQQDVVQWLMEGDPGIRWQVMRDLLHLPTLEWQTEQARVESSGWGAALLARQDPDGRWGGSLYSGKWVSTTYSLYLLELLGLPPGNPRALRACELLLAGGLYQEREIRFSRGQRLQDLGVSGLVLSVLVGLGFNHAALPGLASHLVESQQGDGSWLADDSPTAGTYVFECTLLVLAALNRWAEVHPDSGIPGLAQARTLGARFLLANRLGLAPANRKPGWSKPTFPCYWFYDVLSAVREVRAAGLGREPDLQVGLEFILNLRAPDGTWPLGPLHPGKTYFQLEKAGPRSRWMTLRALSVLSTYR